MNDEPLLIRIKNAIRTLETLEEAIQGMGKVSEIECGKTSLDWLPILDGVTERVAKKGALKTSVTGAVKKSLLAGSLMKNAEPILNQVKILGKSPNDVEDIERLKGIVKFDHLISTYLIDMNLSSSVVPISRYDQVIWLNEQKKLLQKSIDFAEKLPRLDNGKLYKQGLREQYRAAIAKK